MAVCCRPRYLPMQVNLHSLSPVRPPHHFLSPALFPIVFSISTLAPLDFLCSRSIVGPLTCRAAKYVLAPNSANSNAPKTVPATALPQTIPLHTSNFLIKSATATNPANQNTHVVDSADNIAYLCAIFGNYHTPLAHTHTPTPTPTPTSSTSNPQPHHQGQGTGGLTYRGANTT